MLRHALTSSTQPKIWSIHVVVRTRTTKQCTIRAIVLWRSRSRRRRRRLCVSSLNKRFAIIPC